MKISIPYGFSALECEVPDRDLLGVFESRMPEPEISGAEYVINALEHPIGSEKLESLAVGKRHAVVLTSDHTRPVPSCVTMPEILKRLRAGQPDIDIAILVATGFHRAASDAEIAEKFGPEIAGKERIVIHDCTDDSALTGVGALPSGTELFINRLAAEADLLVAEGFIEPHFFAGFSGGRKSVLPGIVSARNILENHCAEFIRSPYCRAGILENNPIHLEMLAASRLAGLDFILNVVLNERKEIVHAVAGNCEAAHLSGCNFLKDRAAISVPEADIVITSNGGYPLDQNVYQTVKGMTSGEAVCRRGGVIILAASCIDGIGGDDFYRLLREAENPETLLRRLEEVPRNATVRDQWQVQIMARVLSKCRVIMVTRDLPHRLLRDMKLMAASGLPEALAMARQITGDGAKIAVIPDGVSVIAATAEIK